MSIGEALWRVWSRILRDIRRNSLAFRLARGVPRPIRAWFVDRVERGLRWVVAVDTTKPYKILGHKMYLHPDMEHAYHFVTGVYERDLVSLFQRLLQPEMCFVDIGAHIGYYTLFGAKRVGPRGKVYAFEPQPDVREVLKKNVSINGYETICRVVPKAVCEVTGVRPLFIGKQDISQTGLFPGNRRESMMLVETVILDDFFAQEGWPPVDLIKMDIEGAEKYALTGMHELSRRNPNLKMVMEYGQDTVEEAGYTTADLIEVLQGLGFKRGYAIETGMTAFWLDDGWLNIGYANIFLTKGEVPWL